MVVLNIKNKETILKHFGHSSRSLQVTDLSIIEKNCTYLKKELGVEIFYPVKTNNRKPILKKITELGGGLEVNSASEMIVKNARYISSVSRISKNNLIELCKKNIETIAVDTIEQIDLLAKENYTGKIALRLKVPPSIARWVLAPNLGSNPEELIKLYDYAQTIGYAPCSLFFHIGSYAQDISAWQNIWYEVKNVLRLRSFKFLNIGGGIPPDSKETRILISKIKKLLSELGSIKLIAEPGRFTIANAAKTYAKIIDKKDDFLKINISAYNGFFELLEQYTYPITLLDKPGNGVKYYIYGNTCSPRDYFGKFSLNNPQIGDIIVIHDAGAYTVSYFTNPKMGFNGIGFPKEIFIN